MNTIVIAGQAVALLCGCVVLLCRFAHMDSSTPADVRHQHGWLFASLAMAGAVRAEYGADASALCVVVGVLLYLFYGSRRWLHKVRQEAYRALDAEPGTPSRYHEYAGGSSE